jgi:hypothetical protein
MEAACSSKMFASIYDPTCYQNPEAHMHQMYTNMQHISLSQKATNIYTGSKIKLKTSMLATGIHIRG